MPGLRRFVQPTADRAGQGVSSGAGKQARQGNGVGNGSGSWRVERGAMCSPHPALKVDPG